ncbi:putative zinc finger protein [Orchesella cincta]|uniref:Putative zinc finger protein n=1 Tax=Orchesella cincta TaxID=48709 RepID=A0A1D2M4E5_ORCCI|nr:putative zinc finger protein [Orchesella cincta]
MLYHIRKVHQGDPKPSFKCCVCGKCVSSNNFLQRHLRIHTGETPYFCGVCGRRFAWKSSYLSHLKLHSEEKKTIFCPICGRSFTHLGRLQMHCQSHVKEATYECGNAGWILVTVML